MRARCGQSAAQRRQQPEVPCAISPPADSARAAMGGTVAHIPVRASHLRFAAFLSAVSNVEQARPSETHATVAYIRVP